MIAHAKKTPHQSTRLKAAPSRSTPYGPPCELSGRRCASGMIEGNGVEDSSAGFPPLPQAGRGPFSDTRRKALPFVVCNNDEEGLQGVVVGNVGLLAKHWTPRRGRFSQTPPMLRFAGDRLVATDPRADAGIVSRVFLARYAPRRTFENVPPQEDSFRGARHVSQASGPADRPALALVLEQGWSAAVRPCASSRQVRPRPDSGSASIPG